MCTSNSFFTLDNFQKIATIVIAIANLFLLIKYTNFKNKKEDKEKENDRKINWLKTLILDHNLSKFYSFFDSVKAELANLRIRGMSDSQKETVDSKVGDHFINLRRDFIDILLAIDDKLYKQILEIIDKLQAHLTNTTFDDGINLDVDSKFNDLILEVLTKSKTDIIKLLFHYRG
jgi:hypothetical protein